MRKEFNDLELMAELEDNISDEAEARQKYYELLAKYEHLFSYQEIEDIREIIAEELKHTDILNKMIWRRNHIIAER